AAGGRCRRRAGGRCESHGDQRRNDIGDHRRPRLRCLPTPPRTAWLPWPSPPLWPPPRRRQGSTSPALARFAASAGSVPSPLSSVPLLRTALRPGRTPQRPPHQAEPTPPHRTTPPAAAAPGRLFPPGAAAAISLYGGVL